MLISYCSWPHRLVDLSRRQTGSVVDQRPLVMTGDPRQRTLTPQLQTAQSPI